MSQKQGKCPNCGELLASHWRVCPVCERPIKDMSSGRPEEGGIYVGQEVLKGGGTFRTVREVEEALRSQAENLTPTQPRIDWANCPPEELPPLPEVGVSPEDLPPLSDPRDLPKASRPSNSPPALIQAIRSRSYAEVEQLLKHGADPNGIGPDGWTPLHAAAEVEERTMINMLVRYGAVLILSNGLTPWHIAVDRKNPQLASLLAEIRDRTGGVRYLNKSKRP
jgi:hypothetical protein